MTDEAETNTKEQKTKDHNGRGNVSTGNVPAIEELPDSLKETLNNEESIISQN